MRIRETICFEVCVEFLEPNIEENNFGVYKVPDVIFTVKKGRWFFKTVHIVTSEYMRRKQVDESGSVLRACPTWVSVACHAYSSGAARNYLRLTTCHARVMHAMHATRS